MVKDEPKDTIDLALFNSEWKIALVLNGSESRFMTAASPCNKCQGPVAHPKEERLLFQPFSRSVRSKAFRVSLYHLTFAFQ